MRLTHRPLRAGVVAAASAAVALTVAVPGPAQATVRPAERGYTLLDAADLPPAPTPWAAGPVTEGAGGERFCVETRVPNAGSVHRSFHTELDTGGAQIVHEAASVRDARDLTAELREAVETCAERFAERYPEGKVRERDHGRVHALQTEVPQSSRNVNMIGVARSGRLVTVVEWGQMGTLEDAPVREFRRTLRTAVDKLR
ncbi:hypothetical protein WDH52_22190 [Streptomyces sp. TRM70308]|uniref:hypothetical protein n=1 Tax=Streptomyces sp. TRM70308 TaxID=3131932 RepID=UPI003D050CFC